MRGSRKLPLLRSLRARLLVPLLAVPLVVIPVSAWFSLRSIDHEILTLVRADVNRCSGLIERATHDGMLLNRKDEVRRTIERLGHDACVTAIRVYDMQGTVTMSASTDEIGTSSGLDAPPCRTCHGAGVVDLPDFAIERGLASSGPRVPVLRHVAVIANTDACAAPGCHVTPAEQGKLGVLEVEFSIQPLEQALADARWRTFWTMGVLLVVIGVVSLVSVNRVVLRPVERLHAGTTRIARGRLDTRIDVPVEHELGDLARAFNEMAGELSAAREELAGWSRKLEEQVLHKSEELQRTQRQVLNMERMASLGTLSATVAHELNNPISSMLTYARLIERQLAEQTTVSPELREELSGYLRFLQQECMRCGTITQNLLLFARNDRETRMAPTDLNEVVARSLMLIRHHLEIHDIERRHEPLQGDATVVADAGRIEQALVALMVNAVEAMTPRGERGGELSVVLHGNATQVEIAIGDTGVGIPAELQARIFEPFFTTKQAESGVGLGLAVVYGIVHRHGGEIRVDSTPGRGTTFRVSLPRKPPPSDPTGGGVTGKGETS